MSKVVKNMERTYLEYIFINPW